MKSSLLALSLSLLALCAAAQSEVKVWTAPIGANDADYAGRDAEPPTGYAGNTVAVDPFGNVIVTGGTHSILGTALNGRYDLYVAKYDSSGNRLWLVQRGTSEREFGQGVATDASGNIYVTGYTGTNLDGNITAGGWDIFLMKFDPNGNWLWTRQDGTSGDDEAHAAAVDSAGNVYITGYVRGNFHGNIRAGATDIFVSKYDPSGNRLWSALIGSNDVDEGAGIACDSANNVYVTGYVQASVEGSPWAGDGDNILVKYDSNGARQWFTQWGTSQAETGHAVKADASGNVYVAGYTTGNLYDTKVGGREIFLAKYNSTGSLVWGRQKGTPDKDDAYGVTTDAAGNIFITGETSDSLDGNPYQGAGDVFVIKFNAAGTIQWEYEVGSIDFDHGSAVAVDTNGDVFVSGFTYGNFDGNVNQGLIDAFILKLAPSNSVPPKPTALPATGLTISSFTANWLSSSWATGYRLDVSSNSSFSTYLAGYSNLDVGNVLSWTLAGLQGASPYYYRVRAYGTNGTSGNSLTVALATISAGCATPILLNNSFEGTASGGLGTNWVGYQRPPFPTTVYSIQTANPPPGAGLQYQQIANTSSAGGGGVRQDIVGCAIGATYVVSGFMRGNSLLATCRVKVSPTASTDWNTAIDLDPAQFVSTNNWVPFSGTVVATSTNMTLWLDGTTGGTGQNKAECFDQVTVTCHGPVTPLSFTSVASLPADQVSLVVTGAAGAGVTIQRSSNLVDWVPWTYLFNGSGTLQLTDAPPVNTSQRFYRAKSP